MDVREGVDGQHRPEYLFSHDRGLKGGLVQQSGGNASSLHITVATYQHLALGVLNEGLESTGVELIDNKHLALLPGCFPFIKGLPHVGH